MGLVNKYLSLSRMHMPLSRPDFGWLTNTPFRAGNGYVVVLPPRESYDREKFETPGWLEPIVREAYSREADVIIFHQYNPICDLFRVYDW